jgi:hypothetical protein
VTIITGLLILAHYTVYFALSRAIYWARRRYGASVWHPN